MIVIARSYGQLGNRLFLYAHMIAAARHHHVQLANPCFAEYADLFPATAGDLWCRYPVVPAAASPPSVGRRKVLAKSVGAAARCLHTMRLRKYPFHILRLRGEESYDLASEDFASLLQTRRHVLAAGWLFRSELLLSKYADVVRDHFRIAPIHQQKVDRTLSTIRESADLIVGVHVRHGDYATFMNGKYYYSIKQYARMMKNIADQVPGRRVAFLVCSNVPLDRREFGDLQVHFGPGHIIEDMYSFAQTDLLVGPPSTYTGWASFYGNVPLAVMHQADTPIDLAGQTNRHAA